MATTIKPFPHYQINVKDNSIYTVEYTTILPVHRPLWIMKAQEGPVGDPIWCPSYAVARNTFGEQTFTNTNKKYFSRQAKVLLDTLTYNGAFICRVADSTAAQAVAIIEAWVVEKDDLPKYILNADGTRVTDSNGEYLVEIVVGNETSSKPLSQITEDDTVATVPGVEITYKRRTQWVNSELDNGVPVYDYSSIPVRDFTDEDGNAGKIYPIMVVQALYLGEYGNDLCFSLYYKKSENKAGDVDYYKTLFYSLAPARRDYNSSTVSPHYDKYTGTFNSFAANPDTLDPNTGAELSMAAVFNTAYDEESHQLPFTIYTYEENINKIGITCLKYEPEKTLGFKVPADVADGSNTNTTLGYRVNIVNARNLDGNPYNYVKVVTTATSSEDDAQTVMLAEGEYIYLMGGHDGDLSDLMVQNGISQFTKLKLNPMVVDKFRYPFTHIYDIGYNFDVKYDLIDFLDVRDDIIVEMSTQVLMDDNTGMPITLNTQMQDESNGAALRSHALLMRESILKGTDCCRCAIYAHTGFLADGVYNEPMPATYWSAMKHAKFGNLPYMNPTEPRGWPESYNEFFKVSSLNWINYDPEGQSRVWSSGINYLQWADMNRVFYPALRTVYRAETSVLVDQWFVDAVVYTKHVVRNAWGKFTGRNDKSATLQFAIKQYLDTELAYLYSGKYEFEVLVYQTAEEQKIGYIQHVLIRLTSPSTLRVLDIDIEVNREGFDPNAE